MFTCRFLAIHPSFNVRKADMNLLSSYRLIPLATHHVSSLPSKLSSLLESTVAVIRHHSCLLPCCICQPPASTIISSLCASDIVAAMERHRIQYPHYYHSPTPRPSNLRERQQQQQQQQQQQKLLGIGAQFEATNTPTYAQKLEIPENSANKPPTPPSHLLSEALGRGPATHTLRITLLGSDTVASLTLQTPRTNN